MTSVGCKQRRDVDLERVRQGIDVAQTDVALAPLHRAYVRPMKPGAVCECLLRQAALLSEHSHPPTECLQPVLQVYGSRGHSNRLEYLMTLSRQSLSSTFEA